MSVPAKPVDGAVHFKGGPLAGKIGPHYMGTEHDRMTDAWHPGASSYTVVIGKDGTLIGLFNPAPAAP